MINKISKVIFFFYWIDLLKRIKIGWYKRGEGDCSAGRDEGVFFPKGKRRGYGH